MTLKPITSLRALDNRLRKIEAQLDAARDLVASARDFSPQPNMCAAFMCDARESVVEASKTLGLTIETLAPARVDPVRWFELSDGQRAKLERSRMLRDLLSGHLLSPAGGISTHSSAGLTLGFLVSKLEEAKRPYRLKAIPGEGYELSTRTVDNVN